MYTNESNHRFPALVLAAGLTIAVMMGLSALAQTRGGITAMDMQQGVAAAPSVTQAVASEASDAPLRINVTAYRS